MIVESKKGNNAAPEIKDYEVGLGDIISFFKSYWKLLCIVLLASWILGYFVSYLLPVKYSVETSMIPESSSGGITTLASLALSSSSDEQANFRPDLYPDVLQSFPFGEYLLLQPVVDREGKRFANLKEYIRQDTASNFIERTFSNKRKSPPKDVDSSSLVNPGNKSILVPSGPEYGDVNMALKLVSATYDAKTSVITITADTEDPYLSAIVAEDARNYLIRFIDEYRSAKTNKRISNLTKQVEEVRKKKTGAEFRLRSYQDQNRGMVSQVGSIEQQKLSDEYELQQGVYSSLVRQLEDAKVRVNEEKSFFKVLEPTKVPLSSSSPNRKVMALVIAMVGLLLAVSYIFLRIYLKGL